MSLSLPEKGLCSSPGGSVQQEGWSGGARWLLQFVFPLPLGILHGHAEPPGGAAAGGGVAAVRQVRHAGGARVLRAVTCNTRGLQTCCSPSWQHS